MLPRIKIQTLYKDLEGFVSSGLISSNLICYLCFLLTLQAAFSLLRWDRWDTLKGSVLHKHCLYFYCYIPISSRIWLSMNIYLIGQVQLCFILWHTALLIELNEFIEHKLCIRYRVKCHRKKYRDWWFFFNLK